jgi:hypothetical protein
VVGFSMGLPRSRVPAPQVIAYVTAWALFALQRLFLKGNAGDAATTRLVARSRVIAAAVLAAAGAMLLGRP